MSLASSPKASKTWSKKSFNFSGKSKKPAPRPLAVTVPDGQPRFRFISSYPSVRSFLKIQIKCLNT